MKVKGRKCYICRNPLTEVSPYNHRMCPKCGYMNEEKKWQTANLSGHIALLTGGRIKIGYEIGLKLLRSNAKVIITTRFPIDAAIKYSKEKDFNDWKDNLLIYKIDFRNLTQVDIFINTLLYKLPYLDILINNAAQTIQRPVEYYEHLRHIESSEQKDIPTDINKLIYTIGSNFNFFNYQRQIDVNDGQLQAHLLGNKNYHIDYSTLFPINQVDSDGLQVDLRKSNSWVTKIEDVSVIELLEVQIVNSTVPFLLCGKLKRLFMNSPHKNKFIVNVSAMEGNFNKVRKNAYHPHTNMAKAALNMLTRTIAKDYRRDNIYVNSVDTGWVTDENPHQIRGKNCKKGLFPPLDCIDGAARVCAPIFEGLKNDEELLSGHFIKDYSISLW